MENKIVDSLTIQQYLEGKLESQKMHDLEKQALEDDFLADALEGYTYVIEPAEKLSLLQQRLTDRIMAQEANKKEFSISAQRLSIAAASGVMFVLAAILFWMNSNKTPESTKQVEVNLSTLQAPVSQPDAAESIKRAQAVTKAVTTPIFALAENSLSRSQPVVSWAEYAEYIEKNIRQSTGLKANLNNLIISFKIGESGNPVDITIVEGAPDELSEHVTRIIKNGPLWKHIDSEQVTVRINFNK